MFDPKFASEVCGSTLADFAKDEKLFVDMLKPVKSQSELKAMNLIK